MALPWLVSLNLLCQSWNMGPGHRHRPLVVPSQGQPRLALLPPTQTSITFTNVLSDARAAENQIRLNGSGVALGDIDGDGRCDIYLCGLENANALYRNLGGERFEDVTAPAGVACAGQYSTGATFADVDGDQDVDLLVNGVGTGTRLFLNDGQGRFQEAVGSGLLSRFGPTTATLGDVDGDGDLDLYVANYRTETIRSTGFAVYVVDGRRIIPPQDRDRLEYTPDGRIIEHGEPDVLYLNDGTGRFRPVSWTQGAFLDEDGKPLTRRPFDWGLSAMFRDLNGDLAPDLYVCNDFQSPDKVWINDGRGRFRLIDRFAFRHTSTFSMSLDFGDLNRDGFEDILVADMLSQDHVRRQMQMALMDPFSSAIGVFDDCPQLDRTVLQLNRGDGTYADVVYSAGLSTTDWTWSVVLLDVDLDGYEDVLCATGHMFDTQDLDAEARIQAKGPWRREAIPQKLLMFSRMPQRNLAFRNRGDLTFEPAAHAWGFDQLGVSQGMALGDLDNDGDLDLVVNNLNSAAGVYRNESAAPRIKVRLRGERANTRGVGARIRLLGGAVPEQTQEMICGGRYLSGDEMIRTFAMGSASPARRIEVRWRSGQTSVVTNILANHDYEVIEGVPMRSGDGQDGPSSRTSELDEPGRVIAAASRAADEGGEAASRAVGGASVPASRAGGQGSIPETTLQEPSLGGTVPEPHFAEVLTFHHRHVEEAFDDFARQPLLPNRLSQLGPGVAWHDLDGDGWEDLVVGSGKGGRMAAFRNDSRGSFTPLTDAPWPLPVTRDQGGMAAWRSDLLIASMNYEDGLALGSGVVRWSADQAALSEVVSADASSIGPIAVADIDGDGDLDLFVGARVVPGKYPRPARSRVFRSEGGRFSLDATNTAILAHAGLVSAAVWTDLDGDGLPELALACDWGPVRVFANRRGTLREATSDWGLTSLSGWWNGINAGDFDNDGRLDLLASNWGLNTKYQASDRQPLPLYHGDFDNNGTWDIIEAYYHPALGKEMPERDLLAVSSAMPQLRARYPTHHDFGRASVADLLGTHMATAQRVEVRHLQTTLFLNRSNRFDVVPLPAEAQFSPAFAVCIGDLDGDGHEDVFLSQNHFSAQPRTSRADAGRGLWLSGDGRGRLKPVPGQVSGLRVYGEQRGAALADFDQDGRVDLVVTQNGAATRLFRNQGAKPGVRVRLRGPAGNPAGIGAVLRAVFRDRRGPAREVHAGSGYWSQDSAVQVLGGTARPDRIWVRWPGGQEMTVTVPAGAREIAISHPSVGDP
jgi:hypothetical protein